jgi:hypothetical protein
LESPCFRLKKGSFNQQEIYKRTMTIIMIIIIC